MPDRNTIDMYYYCTLHHLKSAYATYTVLYITEDERQLESDSSFENYWVL